MTIAEAVHRYPGLTREGAEEMARDLGLLPTTPLELAEAAFDLANERVMGALRAAVVAVRNDPPIMTVR